MSFYLLFHWVFFLKNLFLLLLKLGKIRKWL
jgi:hypothetical protein